MQKQPYSSLMVQNHTPISSTDQLKELSNLDKEVFVIMPELRIIYKTSIIKTEFMIKTLNPTSL